MELDNYTLTHLLGYLEPKQWADSLEEEGTDKEPVRKLIKQQEKVYEFSLMPDVENCLNKS